MNQLQQKYVMKRINDLEQIKKTLVRDQFQTDAVKLSREQQIDALKKGKYTIIKPRNRYDYWYQLVEFEGEVKSKFDQKGYTELCRNIRAEADQIRDNIMLGELEDVLEMISKFEDKEFK